MRSDIRPGATFPDYELPDQTSTRHKLSELQGDNPMVLLLSRGHYCPKDRHQHRHLVDFYPELKVGYTRIVSISTDSLLETNEFRDGLGAQWPFLSDPGRTVQKDLDPPGVHRPQHNPMIPHTLVLEPGLKIYKIYNGYWYWGRPSVEELRTDLRAILSRIRPDWDLTAPGLRQDWERGEKQKFWPYGKSLKEVFAGVS